MRRAIVILIYFARPISVVCQEALSRLAPNLRRLLGRLSSPCRSGRRPYHATGTPRLAAVLPGLPIAMRDAPSRPERSADRRSWRQKFALCSEGSEWIFANWPRVYPAASSSGNAITAGTLPTLSSTSATAAGRQDADRTASTGPRAAMDDRGYPAAQVRD